jgi:hypothetical protein
MSFTENDRKLRSENGKSFHERSGDERGLVVVIAEALKADFGSAPASVKRVARMTRANERAVRNWFDGKNGPSAANLICLIQHSDALFAAILGLSQRSQFAVGVGLQDLRLHLIETVAAIDAVQAESR